MNAKLLLVLISSIAFAGAVAPAGEVLLQDDFSREKTGPGWAAQFGEWTIVDGALRGSQVDTDNHAAAARRTLETKDAVYQLRFRLGEESQALHFGFDPKRGSLDKKGHLFSVIVDKKGWKILKHVDKNRPKEVPNETLANSSHTFSAGEWYSLVLKTKGSQVIAEIEGVGQLEAEHETFDVPKPTLVFRVVGGPVDVDDLKVESSDE